MTTTQVLTTPGGINFSGFYYPELLREGLLFLRTYRDVLGLTDENDYESHIQILRAFAAMGHNNNARLDTVANELFIESCQLLESMQRLLRLMGIELKSASPASADLLLRLSSVTTSNISGFVPSLADFATDSLPPIIYEAPDEGVDLDRTDQVNYVYVLEETDSQTSDGFVNSLNADIFNRTAGAWAASVVGLHLFVYGSAYENGGEFRVTQRIDDKRVRVVRIPGSSDPGFSTESGLDWSLKQFTSNYALSANTALSNFAPWSGTPVVGDMLYIGHSGVMWTGVEFDVPVAASGLVGFFEYPDFERSLFHPKTVTHNVSPGTLTFDLETLLSPLLGAVDRRGVQVRVRSLITGVSEVQASVWTGSANTITTGGLLGQSVPSTSVTDYHITADWIPLASQDNGTTTGGSDFAQDGVVTWDLPYDEDRAWQNTDVNLNSAMWLRYRVAQVSTPTAPTFDTFDIAAGDQYLAFAVTQGETVGDIVIGSSDGSTAQEFLLPQSPYLDDSELIEVDETGAGVFVEYTSVPSLLYSTSTDRHYRIKKNAKGQARVVFGDGQKGRIPPVGINNIRATYRKGGAEDGNVGIDTITVNASGIAGVSSVTNPRSAFGWRQRDGSTPSDLERVRRDAPAEFRVRGTASTPEDAAWIATRVYKDDRGVRTVSRAFGVEGGFGIKTLKLLVVGEGGDLLTSSQLDELKVYFNGDRYSIPAKKGVFVANQQVIPVNYRPLNVAISASVEWPDGSVEQIRNRLLSILSPTALDDDGVTYLWEFSDKVSYSKIHSAIHSVSPNIVDVSSLTINGAPSSLSLGADELPVSTSASISITLT